VEKFFREWKSLRSWTVEVPKIILIWRFYDATQLLPSMTIYKKMKAIECAPAHIDKLRKNLKKNWELATNLRLSAQNVRLFDEQD